MPEPTYIDGKIIVTAKDASRIFGLSLLMVVGVLGSYFFAIWACRKVYERVFS
jgi:hypothetical protein